MAPDPSASSVPAPSCRPYDKVRLIFRKEGSLRWLSHHDLLRTFERMLRRSQLPVRSTQGFHPHPRLVFALSLPVGVIGCAEVAELELNESLDPQEVQERLLRECPRGLTILSTKRIDPKDRAQVVGFTYAIEVPEERVPATKQRIEQALSSTDWLVERERPARRTVNIRPFVRALRLDPHTFRLEMDLWLTSAGTARPEEVLDLVGLADLLEQGAPMERVRLELANPQETA